MTNTTPTNQPLATPNHLALLIAAVMDSIESIQPPPLSTEPGFEEYLNNQALLQQLQLAQHHKISLEANPSDQAAAAGLQKALALVERSRTRTTRPTKNDQISTKTPRERDDAMEFLKGELDLGRHPADLIVNRARELGISAATLRRAKAALNVVSEIHVLPDRSRFWTWELPEHYRKYANTSSPNSTVSVSDHSTLHSELITSSPPNP